MLARRTASGAARLASRTRLASASRAASNLTREQRAERARFKDEHPLDELLRNVKTLQGRDDYYDIRKEIKHRRRQLLSPAQLAAEQQRDEAVDEEGNPLHELDWKTLSEDLSPDEIRELKDYHRNPEMLRGMPDEAFFSLDTDDQAELNDLAAEDRERDEAYELSEPVDGGDDPEESTTKRKYRGAHNLDNIQAEEDTTGSLGFRFMQIERQWLHYMRLIEGDMFMLQGLRQEYEPPTADNPIVVRTVHYNGERHPVTRKRVFTVPVALLPLRDDLAVHKFKLLAGPRWTQRPPTDSGIGETEVEVWGHEGYFKIAVEDLPEPIQNLKFASDVLDQLIETANDTAKDDMTDIPIDERHVVARYKRNPKFDRFGHRASKDDFPIEWLHISAGERQKLVGEDAFLTRERERGEDYSIDKEERTLQRWRDKREWMDTLSPAERGAVETAEARSDEFNVFLDADRWRAGEKSGMRLWTAKEEQAELERQRRREAGQPEPVEVKQKELPLAEDSDGNTTAPPNVPPST